MRKIISKMIRAFVRFLPYKLEYLGNYLLNKRKIPNLYSPKDYSEFIARDMLFNKHHQHFFLADKYKVREFVSNMGLDHILTRLYGVWNNADLIDFKELPNKFVLKCNHSCAMNIICTNKELIDLIAVREQLNKWLKTPHPIKIESHYNLIKPLIICEEYISDNSGIQPKDYKIHCANGKPVFIQVAFNRSESDPGQRIIYDTNWNNLDYVIKDDVHYDNVEQPKPKHLKQMLEYASILSKELKYARVDFYDTDEKVFFGEITLTPMGGWLSYMKQEALLLMGSKIRSNS